MPRKNPRDYAMLYDRNHVVGRLHAGDNLDLPGLLGHSILIDWLERADQEVVLLLFANGASVANTSFAGEGVLELAVEARLHTVVHYVLLRGCDPNKNTGQGPRPLFRAARNGDVACIEMLLKAGATVDGRSYGNETALMSAAENGHYQVTEMLIAAGADLEARSASGWTPLMHAGMAGRVDIARLLVDSGADPLGKDDVGRSAAHFASERFDPILAQGFRDLGIRDGYSIDENIMPTWVPTRAYSVFLSYKQLHYKREVDALREVFQSINIEVFVDRHEFNLDASEMLPLDLLKVNLRAALRVSEMTLFLEINWNGSYGLPRLALGHFDWQFFELLHSRNAMLISTHTGKYEDLVINPGSKLAGRNSGHFRDYRHLGEILAAKLS